MGPITWTVDRVRLSDLQPWGHNPRHTSKRQAQRLLQSWQDFGQVHAIAVGPNNEVYDGHQRLSALLTVYGDDYEVDVRRASRELSDVERRALVLALHAGAVGSWDWDELTAWDPAELQEWGLDEEYLENINRDQAALIEMLEMDDGGTVGEATSQAGAMFDKFIIPPFSVLDARQGYWQERKKRWFSLGIDGTAGRPDKLVFSAEGNEVAEKIEAVGHGTSIIDPVLCELCYRWFCPPGGLVINPTAGESVYGLVASYLGYRYKGVEIREEQVAANRANNDELGLSAEWILGDGRNVYELVGEDADFIMCCPPYADLEVYSDLEDDLSTMEYDEFLEAYRTIISESVRRLRDDRFAAFVVGDVRDGSRHGYYRNFVGDTIQAFLDTGCHLYNHAILVTTVGSAAIRAGRPFTQMRKLATSHQHVLIFVKGDPKAATVACGEVEVHFPDGTDTDY